jgi:hypothetical protein
MSTNRLALKLGQIGFTAEQLDTMERKDMLQAYAQAIVDGRDKPEAPAPAAIAPDPDVEKLRLQLESQTIQLQAQLESQRLQNDQFQKELAFHREEAARKEALNGRSSPPRANSPGHNGITSRSIANRARQAYNPDEMARGT